tara:strand:- start:5191 stop:6711 length:1521 start_codon:yes stop_codon:yes gene_type:complete
MSLHDIKTLILSHHPIIVMETIEEEQAAKLVREASEQLGMEMFEWTVTSGLCRSGDNRPLNHQSGDPVNAIQHVKDLHVEGAFLFKDIGAHVENPVLLRTIRDLCDQFRFSRSCLVMTGSKIDLPHELEHEAVSYTLQLPDEEEIGQLFDHTVKSASLRQQIDLAVSDSDRQSLIRSLTGMTRNQARQCLMRAIFEDRRLDAADIVNLQEMKAATIRDGGLLEYYPPQENAFQLGGFENLQSWLNRAALGFSDQAREWNLTPPRGVLLTGVQGCGKSLAAKVIARQWQIPLLKLDAGQLFDKYIGQSEANFRKAAQMAESMAPCVLWIDEIEKAFASGGDVSTDGGTSQRLLASFLTWMQEKKESVFLVATANNLQGLPPEMIRKGRFDEIFFVDLPTPSERLSIWDIHLRLRKQSPGQFDLGQLSQLTEGFSGAEIEQAVIASLYRALEKRVPLHQELLVREIYETVPLSISRAEEVSRLRRYAKERFVSASKIGSDPNTMPAAA